MMRMSVTCMILSCFIGTGQGPRKIIDLAGEGNGGGGGQTPCMTFIFLPPLYLFEGKLPSIFHSPAACSDGSLAL